MINKTNLALSEKLAKAYVGGHSNLKVDMSATPMKNFSKTHERRQDMGSGR